MNVAERRSSAGDTVGGRLEAERARLFVGRAAELSVLEALLELGSAALLAYVYGPGGTGKTELLRQFERRCRERAISVGWVRCSAIPVHPAGFRAAFGAALAPAGAAEAGPRVVLVDGLEHLAPIADALWQTLLPELPSDVRVVLAGRDPPPHGLRTDAAWHRLAHLVRLDNLDRVACLDYLVRRDVPADRHELIVDATFGHPLALAMVADAVAQTPLLLPRFDQLPDLVQCLLEQILRDVPTHAHRLALWSAALVRSLTQELLQAMVPEGAALYGWLQGFTFLRPDSRGLVPHELVRDLLLADLAWREPSREAELIAPAIRALVRSLDGNRPNVPGILSDVLYLTAGRSRQIPSGGAQDLYPTPFEPDDWPATEAMILRHEGPSTARCVAFWLREGGEAYAIRAPDDRLAGYALFLRLDRLAPAQIEADPLVRSVCEALGASGAELPRTVLMRSWMDEDRHRNYGPGQAAAAHLSMVVVFQHRAELLVHNEPWVERLMETMPPGFLTRVPEADCELDGIPFGVLTADFRKESLTSWFTRYALALAAAQAQAQAQAGPPSGLDQQGFERGVREVLRALNQPDLLLGSPLLASQLVASIGPHASPAAAAQALVRLVRDECGMFLAADKDTVYHRILSATYFEAQAKQEAAADALGMAFGTYRRHLATAVRRLTAALWQREGHGG